MKKSLLIILTVFIAGLAGAQTTYYWVGGTNSLFNTTTNWNTALDGSGSSRGSNSTATDILVFNGTNIGGSVPTTGQATVAVNGTITCAQIRLINNADIVWIRSSTGTGTINVSGDGTSVEDFVIESGAKLSFLSTVGSVRVAMAATATGRCSGTLIMNTTLQARIDNTTSGTPGTFLFKSGSSFSTNITASSASYAFGNSSQSSNGWVIFEAGSEIFYLGGYSPHGSGTGFSAIDIKPGNIWHHRASNAGAGGNFFNRQSYGDIIVENNAILTAASTIYRIGNLTVNNGCSFVPATSGQTVVLGNLIVNGDYTSPAAGTNTLVLAGNAAQSISGAGTISLANITIGNNANVTLNKSVAVETDINVYGRLNFGTNQLTGTATFNALGLSSAIAGTGNTFAGNYFITGNATFTSSSIGKNISGAGIDANTSIVSFSSTADSIYLSKPLLATGTSVALSISASGATLQTANTNGFNPAGGSVVASGNFLFQDDINYVIDGATTWPFGVTTGSSGNMIKTLSVDVKANITANKGVTIKNNLLIDAKMTLRPADTVHILAGGNITGAFGATKYIATDYVTATGMQSIVQYDGISSARTIPLGTINYYLPLTITPTSVSNFATAVFQGITTNGLLNGTPFTATQRLRVVNAVWNVTRLSGSGDADLQLHWDDALEGTTFTTLPDSDIGLIRNIGSGPTGWAPPVGSGNNTTNVVLGTASAFGSFSAGAIPQVNAFIYNDLPVKTYGDPDFNGGATSLNTTNPIIYTSSNPAVATIVGNNIHIVGSGTSDITASQMGDGVFPDTTATKTLTVNKAPLTITADNKSRFEGLANPPLTITYTGFVLGETNTVLTAQPAISTTATIASAPGTYPITVSGATAANYIITHVNGTMTVIPKQNQTITFPQPATKTYGNAPFSTGATSTNSTIPITYTSSNTSVATVSGNTITITGAGTTVITAMQAGNDGYFPAPNVARTLTVNKANLTIRATDTTKITGQINPVFRMIYTGFVLGETATNLATQPSVSTTATTNSSPGYYDLIPGGAVTNNYNITYLNGRMTVLPLSGTSEQYLLAYRNSNGNIAVRVYSPEVYLADIIVYDLNGRPVARRNILMPAAGFAYVELPAQSLSSGIYVVAVIGDGVRLEKMIHFMR